MSRGTTGRNSCVISSPFHWLHELIIDPVRRRTCNSTRNLRMTTLRFSYFQRGTSIGIARRARTKWRGWSEHFHQLLNLWGQQQSLLCPSFHLRPQIGMPGPSLRNCLSSLHALPQLPRRLRSNSKMRLSQMIPQRLRRYPPIFNKMEPILPQGIPTWTYQDRILMSVDLQSSFAGFEYERHGGR